MASLLPSRQKTPLRLKLHPPHILSEPLALLFYPATATRISGHFTLSFEAKSASRSSVPMTCDSERAAYAFI
ncbi:hypothetical protein BW899_21690 [Bacillus mycoides]|nr:hypothetical protein BW899_21690 [Bacillus mycoides]OOR67893.1 hypothetical protein BLW98_15415 [Bacillus mycoides]